METEVFGAYNKNDNIRMKSSSGGVFSALAKEVILEGGVVFGAALVVKNGRVQCSHQKCTCVEELEKIAGSKYTPSVLLDTFTEVRDLLKKGKQVLFCGTPCQVAGLKSFVGSNTRLITVDFICHGVPTPKLLDKYIKETYSGAPICNLNFRDKKTGWETYSLSLKYVDGTEYSSIAMESEYMRLYVSDLYLRPACYECAFKGIQRISDITLGDFWAIDYYEKIESTEKKKGISVLLVHSDIGKQLLERASKQLTLFKSSLRIFEQSNIYIWKKAERPIDYIFYKRKLDDWSCKKIIKIYSGTNLVRKYLMKVLRKIKGLL